MKRFTRRTLVQNNCLCYNMFTYSEVATYCFEITVLNRSNLMRSLSIQNVVERSSNKLNLPSNLIQFSYCLLVYFLHLG